MSELDELVPENKPGSVSNLWTRHMPADPEKKAELIESLMRSQVQFDLLRDIIKDLYRQANGVEEDFKNPNWSLVMARQAGYKKALRDLFNNLPRPKEHN